MNDFTKEELKELYCRITGRKGELSLEDLAILGNKIKFMIEDYCEHEWDTMCADPHLCNAECMVCQKCHIYLVNPNPECGNE